MTNLQGGPNKRTSRTSQFSFIGMGNSRNSRLNAGSQGGMRRASGRGLIFFKFSKIFKFIESSFIHVINLLFNMSLKS